MMYAEEHKHGFNVKPDPLGRALEAARGAVTAAESRRALHHREAPSSAPPVSGWQLSQARHKLHSLPLEATQRLLQIDSEKGIGRMLPLRLYERMEGWSCCSMSAGFWKNTTCTAVR